MSDTEWNNYFLQGRAPFKAQSNSYTVEWLHTIGTTGHTLQPQKDASCTAMVLITPSTPVDWVQLPCDLQLQHVDYVCGKNQSVDDSYESSTSYSVRAEKVMALTPSYVCQKHGVRIGSSCIHFVPVTNIASDTLKSTCLDKGMFIYESGESSDEEKQQRDLVWIVDTLTKHTMWSAAFISDGVCSMLVSDDLPQVRETLLKWELIHCYQRSRENNAEIRVICKEPDKEELSLKTTVVPKCRSNHFNCEESNNTCILLHYVCDGKVDCPFGEDEELCHPSCSHVAKSLTYQCEASFLKERSMDAQLSTDKLVKESEDGRCHCSDYLQFRCGSGAIVSTLHRCDHVIDCNDGTDEDGCPYQQDSCHPGQFQCDNGQCIPHTYRYNGSNMCHS